MSMAEPSGGSTPGRTPRKSALETHSYDELLYSMGSGTQTSQDLDPIVMAQDVEILKGRLKQMGKGLLDPRSKLMQNWDFFTLSALFFTATVTPYEVCLLWEEKQFGEPGWFGPLFLINWIVNIIFMIDICFNFFLPYKESIKKGGGTVKSHKMIARNYLCGWFPLDFISVVPVDNIMMAVDTSQISGAGALGAIRMLRLLRLIKLARILRASRIFSRWENSISVSYSTRGLIFYCVVVTFMLHWLACLLGLIAQLRSASRPDFLLPLVEAQIKSGDLTCYGCTPDDPFSDICKSLCLTPCEANLMAAHNAGAGAYDDQVETQLNLVNSQENWVCRYVQVCVREREREIESEREECKLMCECTGICSLYLSPLCARLTFLSPFHLVSCPHLTSSHPHPSPHHLLTSPFTCRPARSRPCPSTTERFGWPHFTWR